MNNINRLTTNPIPEVAIATGCVLIILAAGLGLKSGWTVAVLLIAGVVVGALGLLGQAKRTQSSE